jgi:hypothetical protein
MDEKIFLHPTRGVDPHLCVCPRCGADSGLTLGRTYKAKSSKGWVYASSQARGRVARQIGEHLHWQELTEHEKVPTLCKECEEHMAEIAAVAHTGAAFRCTECGIEGAIRKSEFSDYIRSKTGVADLEPCGIEFIKCEEHNDMGIKQPEERVVH